MRVADPRRALVVCAAALLLAGEAFAADESVTLEDLARRVGALEDAEQEKAAEQDTRQGAAASWFDPSSNLWFQRIRLGGSADTGFFQGRKDSEFHHGRFEIYDTRFFVDAELGEAVELFGHTVVGNAGLSFEWNLVRLGDLENDVGDLYVDLQKLGGSGWTNLQVGRFQIPVGEAYLLYGKGYGDRHFVSNVVGGPWWWDEGLRLYGGSPEGRFSYVASLTNGETPLNDGVDSDRQYTLKLIGHPASWLQVSASGLYTGSLGSTGRQALGGLWLGEAFARPIGAGSGIPTYDHGQVVPTAPNELSQTWLVGGDVIATPHDDVRIWLGYQYYDVHCHGPSLYDRALHSWVAELVLGGGLLHPELRDFYVGARASGLGTYDKNEGYLLDRRMDEQTGWNAKYLHAYSAVLGWRMLRFLTLRAEYTRQILAFVHGVPSGVRRNARELDYWAIELGAHF